jgi:hypothetical protein
LYEEVYNAMSSIESSRLLHAGSLFGLFFSPEDGGEVLTTNCNILEDRTLHHHRKF